MRSRKRREWLLWGIAAVVIVAVARFAFPGRVPLLVDPSRRIVAAHKFHDGYAWLSDNEVLDLQPGHGVGPVVVSVDTGNERPQGPLERALARYEVIHDIRLSPDLRWLLANAYRRDGNIQTPMGRRAVALALRRDDTRIVELPSRYSLNWMPDSHQIAWIDVSASPVPAVVTREVESGKIQRLQFSAPATTTLLDAIQRSGSTPYIRCISADGSAWMPLTDVKRSRAGTFHLGLWRLNWRRDDLREFPLQIPGTDTHSNPGIAFSPDGSQIAVLVDVAVPPWYAPFYRLVRRKAPDMRMLQLWTGRPDGTELRLLAAHDTAVLYAAHGYPVYLRWTPDGRRISFFCGNSLYAFPAGDP